MALDGAERGVSLADVIWDPAVNPPPQALCLGCDEPLWRYGDNWGDKRGILVCVKARLADIGGGKTPDYVFHQPMPAGFRGAPA
jgi:hypothetical protein